MPLPVEQVPSLWHSWRARYTERDERYVDIDEVVRGNLSAVDPDEDNVDSRSPNLVQVAMEDTAEAASLMPTLRVVSSKTSNTAKAKAARQERIGWGYLEASQMDMLVPETVMDLAAFGLGAWVIWPDFEQRLPMIELRDPRFCYPEPGFRPGHKVNRCIFARQVYLSQLPPDYYVQVVADMQEHNQTVLAETRVTLVEYFDEHEYLVTALWEMSPTYGNVDNPSVFPVELERIENKLPVCQVVIGSRISLDKEFRGQFDQVIGPFLAHVRLMGMVLDYADQAVYSDIWVKDLIGEMPWGGGAYVELGPNGAIGRVPPAVTSLNVSEDLDRLVDAIHVGGRWPKSRPGEIDQAIASAKFVEATAGMMNTAIKTYHQILKRMMEQALRLCFLTDVRFFPGQKTISGVLRNQEYIEEYDPAKDIDLTNKVRVEYGLGLGRDPAQSVVMMLQLAAEGQEYISRDFVMENLEGLTDVEREKIRIDVQKFRQMLLAKLLSGFETKEIDDAALPELIDEREKGTSLADLYRKYVVEPRQQQELGPGTEGAGPVLPGAPPGPIPAGEEGLLPPPPPDAANLLARLATPAGPGGSFIGAEVRA